MFERYWIFVFIIYCIAELIRIIYIFKKSIRLNGTYIDNVLWDDFENRRYVRIIEYTDSDGVSKKIRSRFTNSNKFRTNKTYVTLFKYKLFKKYRIIEVKAIFLGPFIRITLVSILIFGLLYW